MGLYSSIKSEEISASVFTVLMPELQQTCLLFMTLQQTFHKIYKQTSSDFCMITG